MSVSTSSSAAATMEDLSNMVAKAAKQSRGTNKVTAMSLARLNIANMKLHGREDDMKVLKSKLLDLKNDNSSSKLPELVLISGVSGTGKSALVMRGLRDPSTKMGTAFAGGKFDLNNAALPLSAFIDATSVLTKHVIEGGMKDEIQSDINATFAEEDMVLLVKALPGCEALLPIQKDDELKKNRRLSSGKEAVSRLQYAIRKLLKIICTNLKGAVLFIDDLQWADTTTLDLLKSIALDDDMPSLLMVGAYREDEVPDTHPLALHLRELKQMGIAITEINIGNLSLSTVTSLVAEALRMEDDEESVKELATTVHKKTDGNAFFVLFFLQSLYGEQFLQFNFGSMKWKWDDEAVGAQLATENVAMMLANKLRRLNWATQNILKVAACLGSKFSISVVRTVSCNLSPIGLKRLSSVVETESESDDDDDDAVTGLDTSINELEEQGLWERESDDVRCFTHDKIQSAAFELIPHSKRDCFRGEIGNILLKNLSAEDLESSLFEVVSLRNCSDISDESERKDLAVLNLRAGKKASENAAFDSAAVYYKAGYELLGSRGWEIDPTAILKLCSGGANACFIIGDLDTMNSLIAEVMAQDIPVVDKFRVYEVKVQAATAATAANEVNVAIDTGLEFRRELGMPYNLKNKSVNTLVIIKEFIKTNRAVGKLTAEEIANLPELTDEQIMMELGMLDLVSVSVYQGQPTLFPLLIFVMIRASLKHGINPNSCTAFGSFGLLLCSFGKLQEGKVMSKAVELMLEKPGYDRMKSKSCYVCEGFINHWTLPLQETLSPLLEGYQVGLRTGDIENAAMNLIFRITHLFYVGRPLEGLQLEAGTAVKALAQINQVSLKLYCQIYVFVAKKLRGDNSECDLDLDGITKIAKEANFQTLHDWILLNKLQLNVYFGDWEDATNTLVESGDLRLELQGQFSVCRFTFIEGLVSIRAAHAAKTLFKRMIWKKKALRSMKLIRGWVKKGSVNLVHFLHLLEAEYAALGGKHKKAEEGYRSAISVATRNGFIHDRALSHEMASAYYASRNDGYWKNYHVECCKKSYTDWGAMAKVEQLSVE